jgi:hypothetical protein
VNRKSFVAVEIKCLLACLFTGYCASCTVELHKRRTLIHSLFSIFLLHRMYSSIETPSNSSESHNNHNQYHSNAFNIHSTANVRTTATAEAAFLAPKSNGCAKSIIRPSQQQPSTIFNSNNNSSRNKFSCGAYNSTCGNNNIENVKPRTMFNEKM